MTDTQVLIITNEEDVTTDFIILELKRRGIPYFRLNSETLPNSKFEFDPLIGRDSFKISFEGKSIQLKNVGAAYYRRPGTPVPLIDISCDSAFYYCETEWLSLLKALYSLIDEKWFNSPSRIDAAENKPLQLLRAAALGFRIPETRITNHLEYAKTIQAPSLIGKPLKNSLIEGNDSPGIIFTSTLPPLDDLGEHEVRLSPVIFQTQIEKKFDVRVTVVREQIFAAAIHSQCNDATKVDWRASQNEVLEHTVVDIPDEIKVLCVAITKQFGLKFSAIDLILDVDDDWWFLEINPNGQWAWIECRTDLQITSAIVDELEWQCRQSLN
ncbi:MAG: hypothetical protein CTY33_02940 [Methylotenera sp.]|nr:MAG: hypothetical protein CTY33_02940 [Methylotenera sp.]